MQNLFQRKQESLPERVRSIGLAAVRGHHVGHGRLVRRHLERRHVLARNDAQQVRY